MEAQPCQVVAKVDVRMKTKLTKATKDVSSHVGASHSHTLLITKRVTPTIWMYTRHQYVMTVESHGDQRIFNPEQILGKWSKKECSILMMT